MSRISSGTFAVAGPATLGTKPPVAYTPLMVELHMKL
jgi:hypothetical protein